MAFISDATIGFDRTVYRVNESNSPVEVCVHLNGTVNTTIIIILTAVDSTATGNKLSDVILCIYCKH